jgi:RHS repeat-associated protein
VTGNVFVAKTPEVFSYDLDGNMTSDGRWNYTWDAENRLIMVESRPDTPQGSWRRIEWTYDAFGLRIQQVTSIWTNNAWFVVENLKFVSDPMLFGRHIVEINGTNNAVVRSYVWGLDLSGTMDGAGGVGGLAWVTLHTTTGPASGTHFTCYDGNGNIVALVSATTGDVTARYEYGPFGEPIRVSGPAANLNPFRFSTKRTDPTTDLVLYENRVYKPSIGRWTNRDPLGEPGFELLRHQSPSVLGNGPNRYLFSGNDPIGKIDPLGLWYDTVTNYMLNCARLPKDRCKCICAPITTGAEDSKKCETDCEKCDDLIKGIPGKKAKADALCLCYCSMVNKQRQADGKAPLDCQKVCKLTCSIWDVIRGKGGDE